MTEMYSAAHPECTYVRFGCEAVFLFKKAGADSPHSRFSDAFYTDKTAGRYYVISYAVKNNKISYKKGELLCSR